MPEPANPQSFNRYAYVRNNPMRFIDPSGHRECGATNDCHDYADDFPDIPHATMVQFQSQNGTSWAATEKSPIRSAARQQGQQLANTLNQKHPYWNLTAPQAFLLVYKGSITFQKIVIACSQDARNSLESCGARTENRNLITVYEDAANIGNVEQWAGHELGHTFVYAVGSSAPIKALMVAQLNPAFRDRTGASNTDNFGFGSTHLHPWLWQQSSDPASSEEFADMVLGWTYGTWASSSEGQSRQGFMSTNMPGWINDAIRNR